MNTGLIVDDITKGYGPVRVLKGVSLRIEPGKVLALIGHNGAGKSTLLRALSGAEVPDSGTITVDGTRTRFDGPSDATAAGIACVYQELSLIDELTVAENVFLGNEMRNGPLLDRRAMNRHTDELCHTYGIRARATDLVGSLPVAQRQLLEVVRGIDRDAKYLLLDEPTTALEQEQVTDLLEMIRRITAERGIGVLLVDHKLDEVFAVADHVVGLANGQIVLDGSIDDVDHQKVIDAIVGDHGTSDDELLSHADVSEADLEVIDDAERSKRFGDIVLAASELHGNGLQGVSLDVHAGEILGIYGLVGSGRSRFLRTVFGAVPIVHGALTLAGHRFVPKSPADAIRNGIAFLSEERKSDGFVPQFTSVQNVGLPVLERFTNSGVINWRAAHAAARGVLSRVTIRGDVSNPITTLSGGNQQKALFARAMLQRPRLLLLDEPTKGVDIGAKREIYRVVKDLARTEGIAVIVVSSEEEELTTLADSIVVFRQGACDGVTYPRAAVTAAQLRELAWVEPAA